MLRSVMLRCVMSERCEKSIGVVKVLGGVKAREVGCPQQVL